jgi:histone H3/H4
MSEPAGSGCDATQSQWQWQQSGHNSNVETNANEAPVAFQFGTAAAATTVSFGQAPSGFGAVAISGWNNPMFMQSTSVTQKKEEEVSLEEDENEAERRPSLPRPVPRRVDCAAVPLHAVGDVPEDFDHAEPLLTAVAPEKGSTLRAAKEIMKNTNGSLEDAKAALQHQPPGRVPLHASWNVERIALAAVGEDCDTYEPDETRALELAAGELLVDSDDPSAERDPLQVAREAEDLATAEAGPTDSDVELEWEDGGAEGYGHFPELDRAVRKLIPLPPPLATVVLEYLEFDADELMEEVIILAARVEEAVANYKEECIEMKQQWLKPSVDAQQQQEEHKKLMRKLKGDEEESAEAHQGQEGKASGSCAGGVNPAASPNSAWQVVSASSLEERNTKRLEKARNQTQEARVFLSPAARQILNELEIKFKTDLWELKQDMPAECGSVYPRKTLLSMRSLLEDELDSWEEVNAELDLQRDHISEECVFIESLLGVADALLQYPSAQITVNEEAEYGGGARYVIEPINQYTDKQEDEEEDDQESEEKKQSGQGDEAKSAAETSMETDPDAAASSVSRKRRADSPCAGCSVSESESALVLLNLTASAPTTATAASSAVPSMETEMSPEQPQMPSAVSLSATAWNAVTSEPSLDPAARSAFSLQRCAHIDKKARLLTATEAVERVRSLWSFQNQDSAKTEEDDEPKGPGRMVPRDPFRAFHLQQRKARGQELPLEQDHMEEFLEVLPGAVLRRRMTPAKHAAATFLVSKLKQLRSLLPDRYEQFASAIAHWEELPCLVESVRLALSNYYLFHMTRSLALDREVAEMNELPKIRMEQRATDLALHKAAFSRLVREITGNFSHDMNWSDEALEALQEVAEDFLTGQFSEVQLLEIHAGRQVENVLEKMCERRQQREKPLRPVQLPAARQEESDQGTLEETEHVPDLDTIRRDTLHLQKRLLSNHSQHYW